MATEARGEPRPRSVTTVATVASGLPVSASARGERSAHLSALMALSAQGRKTDETQFASAEHGSAEGELRTYPR